MPITVPSLFKLAWDHSLNLNTGGPFKIILLKNGWVPDKTAEFVSDVVADEADCTGYVGGFSGTSRKAVVFDVAQNLIQFRLDIGADDQVMGNLGNGTNNTLGYVGFWKPNTTDADSIFIGWADPTNITTNGSPVTVNNTPAASGGIFRFEA